MKVMMFLLLALVACELGTGRTASSSPGYSYGDQTGKNGACLSCHADTAKVKGTRYIDPAKYAHTNHSRIGCLACHDEVTGGHGGSGRTTGKTSCVVCHGDINVEYSRSSHAGNATCNGCHNPHRVNSPNEISGQDMNRMCSSCHDIYSVSASHGKWLPQADLHITMLPCITCHTGSKNYVINLYIVKRSTEERSGKFDLASHGELRKLAEGRDIISLIDTNGDGYVSLAELRNFNRNPQYKDLHLYGMMIPEQVTHSFQILDNRRDCTFCHASGPGAMQTSIIAVPEANGTFRKVAVEKGAVLDALYATPHFYMMGGTRNATLNKIGLVILAGGLVMPVGHGFLRFLTRKIRKEREDRHE